jgi:signal transduction histidine kinase/tetratricopeptide (TPR) repeat protein
MNKALPEAKRIFRRIILTFLLAIILPSGLLGYCGIYAAESQEIAWIGGIRESHLGVANQVYAQLKDEILERERKVRRDVNLFLPAEYEYYEVARVMDRQRLVHKLVKESFLLTAQGRLLFPLEIAAEGVSAGAPSRMLTTIPREEFRKHIHLEELYNEARRLEFSEKAFERAIEKYEQVASNDLNKQLAAESGFAAGRCLSKLSRHAQAAQHYERLFAVAVSIRLMEGMPVPLESHLAAAREYRAAGQAEKAAQLFLNAYSKLLDYGYPLTLDEFHAVTKKIRAELGALDKDGSLSAGDCAEYASLRLLEELRILQDKYANIINNSFVAQLLDAFGKPAAVPQTGRHMNADAGGEKVTVMFFFPFKFGMVGGHKVRYLYGCVLNTDYIRELAEELVSGERFAEGLVVVVQDGGEVMAISTGAPENFAQSLGKHTGLLSAELLFPEIVPHWSIRVYYLNMAKLAQSSRIRLVTHVAMVFLLIVVILVGVFLSLRGISRELELAKLKSDFVSNVSHELKTPLTSIRMFAEMLMTGRVRDSAKQQEYFALMTAETERLSRLINNLLDFAKVEEGRKKYTFALLDANELTQEAARIIAPRIIQKGFDIEVTPSEKPLPVSGDRDSLEQVLLNILNNAVKYSGDAKEINIRAYAKGEEAVIDIVDKGIGIPEEELPKIFTKFYRVDSRPGYESAGTGLGLTLAQQIVSSHGGRIEVKSKVNEGSTFSVVLPLAREQEVERSPEP